MTHPAWIIQIFEMTGEAARTTVANLLTPIEGLTVETAQDGSEDFLIVRSHDDGDARSVKCMVVAFDEGAILRHTSVGPRRPIDVVPHIPISAKRPHVGQRALRIVRDTPQH